MINSFGMVIGNLLGGSLFDKLGGYKTILLELSLVFVYNSYLISFTVIWYAVWFVMLGFWWRNDYSAICTLWMEQWA